VLSTSEGAGRSLCQGRQPHRAAAIRAHANHGGSYGALATAQGVSRATAQRRRDTVMESTPKSGERWATTLPAPTPSKEVQS